MLEPKPLAQITQEAVQILYQKLGIVDTGRFLSQFIVGLGDYTVERDTLFADMTLDDLLTEIKLERKRDDSENQSAVD
jgi:hypothetical protein